MSATLPLASGVTSTEGGASDRTLCIARGTAGVANMGTVAKQERLTLQGLADLLRKAQARPTTFSFDEYKAASDDERKALKSSAWFVCAEFDGTAKRRKEHLTACSAVVLDCDRLGTTREELLNRLELLGCAHIVATSTSHGVKGECYRVIVPLAETVSGERYGDVWTYLDEKLGGTDAGAKDATRLCYLPRAPKGAEALHRVICEDALPWFDPSTVPVAAPKPAAPESAEQVTELNAEQLQTALSIVTHRGFLAAQAAQNRYHEIGIPLQRYGEVGKTLWLTADDNGPSPDRAKALAWWQTHRSTKPTSDIRYLFNLAESATKGTAEPWVNPARGSRVADLGDFPVDAGSPGERPLIQIHGGELHVRRKACEKRLADLRLVYTSGPRLVRLGEAKDAQDGLRRDDSQAVMVSVGFEQLRCILTEHCRFEKFNATSEKWNPVDCPADLARNIEGAGSWPLLPELAAIARAPFIRPDGTLCVTAGYDATSRVFYDPNAAFPHIPENPTREDALQALQTLIEPFEQFPFETPAGRSAFLAHVLSEAVRTAIDTCPLFCYSANEAGSGKTLLFSAAATIVHGYTPAMRAYVEDEEMRKTLFASLLSGDRIISFDNLAAGAKVRSNHLCAFVTAPFYTDRKLGESGTRSIRNQATVLLNGNNITPSGELARRSLVVRLNAGLSAADLKRRTFRIDDLKRYVSDNRPKLLAAALTIVRAYIAAGDRLTEKLVSFDAWSRLVLRPLLWLGLANPLDTQEEETDDESAPLEPAFAYLYGRFGESHFTAQEVVWPAPNDFKSADELLPGDSPLRYAGCSDPNSSKAVGYWLRSARGKVAGGLTLKQSAVGAHAGRSRWFVQPADAADVSDLLGGAS